MPFDTQAAVAEIDAVLGEYETAKKKDTRPVRALCNADHSDDPFRERGGRRTSSRILTDYDGKPLLETVFPREVGSHLFNLMCNTLHRLAPSPEVEQTALGLLEKSSSLNSQTELLVGSLSALRSDYQAGRVKVFRERVHSDMFSDFLEMAEYLLEDEGLKDPAAVMIGGVLEQHIRKLCDKHPIPTAFPDGKPKKLDTLNAELAKANVYGKNEQKQITAWAAIRNDAAHADYAKYKKEDVDLMARWVRNFVSNYPA